MADRVLVEQMLETVKRETEARQLEEAQRRAAEVEAQQRAADQMRENQFNDALGQYQAIYAACVASNTAMLETFGGADVSYGALKGAHSAALAAFNAAIAFAGRAARAVLSAFQSDPDDWRSQGYNNAFAQRVNQFAVPISPANALIRWAADAPDPDARRWRVGLLTVFYPGWFNINIHWPPSDFDPQAASDQDVYRARFRDRGL